MNRIRINFFPLILISFLVITCGLQAQMSVEPIGVASALAADEDETLQLTLSNPYDVDVAYEISLDDPPEEENRRRGPRRDDIGDLLARFNGINQQGVYCSPGGWDTDNGVMWVINSDNAVAGYGFDDDYENIEEVFAFNTQEWTIYVAWAHGIIYTLADWQRVIYFWDQEGELLDSWDIPFDNYDISTDPENGWFFIMETNDTRQIHVYELAENGDIGDRIGTINNHGQFHNNDFNGYSFAWVPGHIDNGGPLWYSVANDRAYQIDVDTDRWTCVENDDAVSFSIGVPDGFDSFGHDNYSMWAAGNSATDIRIYDDGVDEVYIDWVVVNPPEGVIEAESNVEIDLIFQPNLFEDLPDSVYESRVVFEFSAEEEISPALIEFSAVMSLEKPVASLTGTVSNNFEEPVAGVRVDLDRYLISRFSDEDGVYSFDDLPLGAYELTFSRQEYLPTTEAIELDEEGEFELNIELLHGEAALNRDRIETTLVENTSRDFDITVANDGNGPLTYTIERRLPGGAEAQPWEQRFAFQAGEEVQDNRLKGVTFFDENFYVTGIGDEVPMIYVLDREGAMVNSFPQVGTARNGMDGLAWDGELLWGAGENRIYGFSTDGDSLTSFRGVQRTTRAITWDPVNEWLWTADATSDIVAVTRDGEGGPTIRRQNQTIHALAFFEDDPDGFQLFVLSTLNDTLALRKMSLANGELRLVAILEPEGGGEPSGACISSSYDYYSTVFISTVDAPEENGGDRIDIWQVQGNNSWMQVNPAEGTISPDESQDFTLTLDANDLARLDYEGQVVWVHDGFDFEAAVDVLLHVTGLSDPPTAFSLLEPADGDTLPEGNASFIWQQSIDPDPEDVVEYQIWFQQGEDSVMTEAMDTTLLVPLAELGLENVDVHVPVSWWVVAVSGADEVECNARFGFYLPGSGVDDRPAQPAEFALYGAYPNPFNSLTRVSFSVPSVTQTFLSVYDLSGRKVADLWAGQAEAGVHEVVFDAAGLSSGVYLLQLESAGQTARMKAALVR